MLFLIKNIFFCNRNLFFIGVVLIFVACESDPVKYSNDSQTSTYVGSNQCKECHAQAYSEWVQSDHFLAMLPANDSTVLGDFEQATFTADGVDYTFYKEEGKYFINTQDTDGSIKDYEIAYTFGHYPLQQYLISFPGGRLQSARVSWDSRDHKWFHQYPDQEIDHQDWFHWTKASQNWNTMCASCHSTNLVKNYNLETDSFSTTWDEINVSCESCHGPGSTHLEYMQSEFYRNGGLLENSGFDYARDTTPEVQLNACAACHARKSDISPVVLRSDEIMDDIIPQVLSNEYYFPDGQIREEDYVYGSFTQSKMYHNNVRCTNCHNPHTGKLRMEGNGLCLNCHISDYNTSGHHFHDPESEAGQCINCHMLARTYMGVDHRRDHSFRVPRPDQSITYNTPNACTNCHTGESNEWASEAIIAWYGPQRQYHFSDDLLPGSLMDENSEEPLSKLMADKLQPAIARATAAYYLAQIQTLKSAESLLAGVLDAEPIVRYHSLRALENFPPELWQYKVGHALKDSVRAVRIAAADLYHRLPASAIPADIQEDYASANQENVDFLYYQADFSVGSLMIADYEAQEGNYGKAIEYYIRGLEMDSLMNYARLNLATVANITGNNNLALSSLREAAQIDPFNDQILYNLALLQYEMNDLESASSSFQKAIELGSSNTSVYYNYGLLLQQQNKILEAEEIYLMGHAINPQAMNINYALAIFYAQQGKVLLARKYGDILKQYDPGNPEYQMLFQNLGI